MSTERKPLLSDEAAIKIALHHNTIGGKYIMPQSMVAIAVRDWYEAKIASGELRVCTPVKAVYGDHGGIMAWSCSGCGTSCDKDAFKCCPVCGNPITE